MNRMHQNERRDALPRKFVGLQAALNHVAVLGDDLSLVYHRSQAAMTASPHAAVGDDRVISGIRVH